MHLEMGSAPGKDGGRGQRAAIARLAVVGAKHTRSTGGGPTCPSCDPSLVTNDGAGRLEDADISKAGRSEPADVTPKRGWGLSIFALRKSSKSLTPRLAEEALVHQKGATAAAVGRIRSKAQSTGPGTPRPVPQSKTDTGWKNEQGQLCLEGPVMPRSPRGRSPGAPLAQRSPYGRSPGAPLEARSPYARSPGAALAHRSPEGRSPGAPLVRSSSARSPGAPLVCSPSARSPGAPLVRISSARSPGAPLVQSPITPKTVLMDSDRSLSLSSKKSTKFGRSPTTPGTTGADLDQPLSHSPKTPAALASPRRRTGTKDEWPSGLPSPKGGKDKKGPTLTEQKSVKAKSKARGDPSSSLPGQRQLEMNGHAKGLKKKDKGSSSKQRHVETSEALPVPEVETQDAELEGCHVEASELLRKSATVKTKKKFLGVGAPLRRSRTVGHDKSGVAPWVLGEEGVRTKEPRLSSAGKGLGLKQDRGGVSEGEIVQVGSSATAKKKKTQEKKGKKNKRSCSSATNNLASEIGLDSEDSAEECEPQHPKIPPMAVTTAEKLPSAALSKGGHRCKDTVAAMDIGFGVPKASLTPAPDVNAGRAKGPPDGRLQGHQRQLSLSGTSQRPQWAPQGSRGSSNRVGELAQGRPRGHQRLNSMPRLATQWMQGQGTGGLNPQINQSHWAHGQGSMGLNRTRGTAERGGPSIALEPLWADQADRATRVPKTEAPAPPPAEHNPGKEKPLSGRSAPDDGDEDEAAAVSAFLLEGLEQLLRKSNSRGQRAMMGPSSSQDSGPALLASPVGSTQSVEEQGALRFYHGKAELSEPDSRRCTGRAAAGKSPSDPEKRDKVRSEPSRAEEAGSETDDSVAHGSTAAHEEQLGCVSGEAEVCAVALNGHTAGLPGEVQKPKDEAEETAGTCRGERRMTAFDDVPKKLVLPVANGGLKDREGEDVDLGMPRRVKSGRQSSEQGKAGDRAGAEDQKETARGGTMDGEQCLESGTPDSAPEEEKRPGDSAQDSPAYAGRMEEWLEWQALLAAQQEDQEDAPLVGIKEHDGVPEKTLKEPGGFRRSLEPDVAERLKPPEHSPEGQLSKGMGNESDALRRVYSKKNKNLVKKQQIEQVPRTAPVW